MLHWRNQAARITPRPPCFVLNKKTVILEGVPQVTSQAGRCAVLNSEQFLVFGAPCVCMHVCLRFLSSRVQHEARPCI